MLGDRRQATTYRLVLRGELDGRFAALLDGMQLQRTAGTTVLTGAVMDQAHLCGLIDRVQELGPELVSVQAVDEATGSKQPEDS